MYVCIYVCVYEYIASHEVIMGYIYVRTHVLCVDVKGIFLIKQ